MLQSIYEHSCLEYLEKPSIDFHSFESEEDAIFALYEQLFCNLNSVCKETILESMKFLINEKGMTDQMEEINQMNPCDVDIVHHREYDKQLKQSIKDFKKKICDEIEKSNHI